VIWPRPKYKDEVEKDYYYYYYYYYYFLFFITLGTFNPEGLKPILKTAGMVTCPDHTQNSLVEEWS